MSDRELGEAVLAGILDDHHGLLNRVAAFAERYSTGEDPEVRGVLNDATLRISRERFEELVGRFDALVEEYRDDVTTRPDEEHLGWQVLFAAASEEI
jgi:hypothetical protein